MYFICKTSLIAQITAVDCHALLYLSSCKSMSDMKVSNQWWKQASDFVKEYIRETSVIILGLCITYYGDSLVDSYAEEKEDYEAIRMICQELEDCIGQLKTINDYYKKEGEMGSLISDNFQTDFIHLQEDSVSQYYNQLRLFHMWAYEGYAFNMLRESTIIQRIDKELLVKMFSCYDYIETLESINDDYKNRRLTELLAYRSKVRNIEETTLGQWRQCCEDKQFFEYITQAVPLLSKIAYATGSHAIILAEETLAEINSRYPLKD